MMNRMELPPRTRRIPQSLQKLHYPTGTTSAYAENTGKLEQRLRERANYLRVRGEYCYILNRVPSVAELPPRTRRIPTTPQHSPPKLGTTSAYAENTPNRRDFQRRRRNYLRVRGEYPH